MADKKDEVKFENAPYPDDNKKQQKQQKQNNLQKAGNKISEEMHRDRKVHSFWEAIIDVFMLIPRIISDIFARIIWGKDGANHLRKERIANELIHEQKQSNKNTQKEDKTKEKDMNDDKSKSAAIRNCKKNFEGQKLEDIFNDPKKLKIFTKNFDNYLDETFLKKDAQEFDLSCKDGKIFIDKIDRDGGKNRERLYSLDLNEINKAYLNEEKDINYDVYTAMLKLCKDAGIKTEPKVSEIEKILKERIENIPNGKTEDITFRNVTFTTTKDKKGNISIEPLNFKKRANQKINYSELSEIVQKDVVDSMNEKITHFEQEQEINEINERYKNSNIKNFMDDIKKTYGFNEYNIDFISQEISFVKFDNNGIDSPTSITYNFKGDIVEKDGKNATVIKEQIPVDMQENIKKSINVMSPTFENYTFRDIIEVEPNALTGEFIENGVKFQYEKQELSNFYDIYKDDQYMYTYITNNDKKIYDDKVAEEHNKNIEQKKEFDKEQDASER